MIFVFREEGPIIHLDDHFSPLNLHHLETRPMKATVLTILFCLFLSPIAFAGQQAPSVSPSLEQVQQETNIQSEEGKLRGWFRKRKEVVGPRTGLWGLISSSAGGLTVVLTLLLTGPQGIFLLGVGLIALGTGLCIATLVREKDKPRSTEWKLALGGLLAGGLPLLFVAVILLGFLLA